MRRLGERSAGGRVSMLLHKPVDHDSRVWREAEVLVGAGFDVTVLELTRDVSKPAPFRRLGVAPPAWVRARLGKLPNQVWFALGFVRAALRERPDIVHAHDAAMLLPGVAVARLSGARLVYDSHELATGVQYHSRLWALFVGTVERLVLPRCVAVITVSDGIADRLRDKYGLERRPVVVRNVCSLPPAPPAPGLRARLGLGDQPLVLHQGAATVDRGCEVLLQALARVPGAHVCFLGAGGEETVAGLTASARALGVAERAHFLPAEAPERLLALTAGADVGVSLLQDTCDNHRLALPNKLFEYLAAGVPVVVSDLPEMRAVVEGHAIGWTVRPSDATAVADALVEALAQRGSRPLRERVRRAAAHFTWPRESVRLVALYGRLARGAEG